jgi:predicted kinase
MRRPVLKPHIWKVKAFTGTVKALEAARALASSRRPLSLIVGPAGTGKTFAAEFVASRHGGIRIAVCPPRDLLTPMTLLQALARATGLPAETFSKSASLCDAVTARLAQGQHFIILDEADRLHASNADLLRDIAENADVAICFLGCPGAQAVISRVPATHHRVGLAYIIPPVDLDDMTGILSGSFDEPTIVEIYEQTAGNLRHLEALVGLLGEATAGAKKPDMTPALVKAVASQFLLKVAA